MQDYAEAHEALSLLGTNLIRKPVDLATIDADPEYVITATEVHNYSLLVSWLLLQICVHAFADFCKGRTLPSRVKREPFCPLRSRLAIASSRAALPSCAHLHRNTSITLRLALQGRGITRESQ